MAVLNPTLNLYGYDQNCRNNKQWYITAQVIVYELTKTLDDSFAKCLNELYHFKYRGNPYIVLGILPSQNRYFHL